MTPSEAEQLATYWTAAQRTVAGFIRTLVPSSNEAEELLQRVAVVLVRKFHAYDGQRPFVAWAIGIAKTEIIMYRQERTTDRHVFKESLIEQIAETSQRLPSLPIDDQLSQCFEELDVRSQEVVHLRYTRDLRTRQIADEMHMTDSAVRKLLSRARIAIRNCLNRGHFIRGKTDE